MPWSAPIPEDSQIGDRCEVSSCTGHGILQLKYREAGGAYWVECSSLPFNHNRLATPEEIAKHNGHSLDQSEHEFIESLKRVTARLRLPSLF